MEALDNKYGFLVMVEFLDILDGAGKVAGLAGAASNLFGGKATPSIQATPDGFQSLYNTGNPEFTNFAKNDVLQMIMSASRQPRAARPMRRLTGADMQGDFAPQAAYALQNYGDEGQVAQAEWEKQRALATAAPTDVLDLITQAGKYNPNYQYSAKDYDRLVQASGHKNYEDFQPQDIYGNLRTLAASGGKDAAASAYLTDRFTRLNREFDPQPVKKKKKGFLGKVLPIAAGLGGLALGGIGGQLLSGAGSLAGKASE
jgi:hypothetical protein